MAFEINKTELVWPGKYDAEGNLVQAPRVSLPFQVIERVNETRATREAKKAEGLTLFDVWDGANEGVTFEDGWRNKLIWGENAAVMGSLLEQFSGKIDLIYIDPPFDVGADFSLDVEIGEDTLTKQPSTIELVAYRDTWGEGTNSYISTMRERISILSGLLNESGVLLLHCDWRVSAMLRLVGDEIFGADNYRNEIIWSYRTGGAGRGTTLPRKHDTIHVWAKSQLAQINSVSERQYLQKSFMGSKQDKQGRHYVDTILRDNFEGVINIVNPDETIEEFNVRPVLNLSSERTGYPTQKPVGLLKLLLKIFSNDGELVSDFFVGSGTTLVAAELTNRRWIGADMGRYAIHTTRKRLLEIDRCKPFEVLNLGKYERQYWSSSNFGEDLDGDGRVSLLEYLAFVLRLYGAEALSGSVNLHGRKGNAYVHVGSVSSPVTISEIELAVNECKELEGSEVHILGWEWEMGLHDPITGRAKQMGVKLVLRQIPREIMESEAARKGQVKFFELAYLEAGISVTKKKGEYVCTLTDFSTPNLDLIPEEVREKVKKWSDYVDYWAVDWNYQNDTFNHGFVTYRTKQDRSLALKSDPHDFGAPGKYQVMIKVIDIFGNDTSKIIEVTVPK
jgi:adenine-specific DNA-methyltransferase